jgi:hypothetical protein
MTVPIFGGVPGLQQFEAARIRAENDRQTAQAAAGNQSAATAADIAYHRAMLVSIAAGSVQSAAFNARTRMVRLHCDAICSISSGRLRPPLQRRRARQQT